MSFNRTDIDTTILREIFSLAKNKTTSLVAGDQTLNEVISEARQYVRETIKQETDKLKKE